MMSQTAEVLLWSAAIACSISVVGFVLFLWAGGEEDDPYGSKEDDMQWRDGE